MCNFEKEKRAQTDTLSTGPQGCRRHGMLPPVLLHPHLSNQLRDITECEPSWHLLPNGVGGGRDIS